MIVYGDPSYERTLRELVQGLRERVAALRRAGVDVSLDDVRTLLIQAGQLEQAAEDGLPEAPGAGAAQPLLGAIRRVTDLAAVAFRARWAGADETPEAIDRVASTLHSLPAATDVPLRVKVPEGFAFYTLYPEQYCAAALRWAADQVGDPAPPSRVAVIGIRSIGTSLSAVVAATLAAAGWDVRRLTVRPTGHPYARRVDPRDLRPSDLDGAAFALVVDEGPGRSGSSMAAVAAALAAAGIDRGRISFLPGHGGPPGPDASDEVRDWWQSTRRYVVPLDELRWAGRSLRDVLAAETSRLRGGEAVERIEDLSGGLWRDVVYPDADPSQRPSAAVPFERTKLRCVMSSGDAVLWKFAGLAPDRDGAADAAAAAARQLADRARGGWAPAPLGTAFGFVATPWVRGTPLARGDGIAEVLGHVGRYIAAAAGPPLTVAERHEGLARLREMLYWNTHEALGEAAAVRAREWGDIATGSMAGQAAAAVPSDPGYGDGRLAPHEWLRTGDGGLVKMDAVGHDADHTMIGRQPLAWDVAGALVEWDLADSDSAAPLLEGVRSGGGLLPPHDLLRFYKLAYAAFRMGQCALCAAASAHDPSEQARLWRDHDFYKAVCLRLIG